MRVARPRIWTGIGAAFGLLVAAGLAAAGEPSKASYWDVDDVRPGMTGVGKTVMVGTRLDEFGAEVLGVMRDVSPGRDMILVRLTGCNLEHAGIIQGMSGSPIYIDGKLLGAVAYAWEFAKDPIAGVTPFAQMVQYVRSSDRRLAAEAKAQGQGQGGGEGDAAATAGSNVSASAGVYRIELPGSDDAEAAAAVAARATPARATGMAGMRPIATPLAVSGLGPRALAVLERELGPIGMAPMAAGDVPEGVRREAAGTRLVPGGPISVAMVTGDFDISAIGTVTHVEGDRVYAFGHPMMSLGACAFPMMTGYIHTVYPRASVSMKMGSPLETVGVLDTDVSTGIAGRLGATPDLLPMSVTVKTGRYAEPRTYRVRVVRDPKLLSGLVQSVLAGAVDTEGDLPDELTADLSATIRLAGHEPIELKDRVSGARFGGPMGMAALFGPVSSLVSIIAKNPLEPVRVESIDCRVDLDAGRTTAAIEAVRLDSARLQPGETLRARVTLRPHLAERATVLVEVPLPADLPEGPYELAVGDCGTSLRRRTQAAPHLAEPRTLPALLDFLRLQAAMPRNQVYAHLALPSRGVAVGGQALPDLPASLRTVFGEARATAPPVVKAERVVALPTAYVIEGSQTIRFEVVRDAGLALRGE
jgi:hypothetical protein